MKRGGGNFFSSKNAEEDDGVYENQHDGGPNEFKSYKQNLRDHASFWHEKPFVETTYYPDVFEERTLSIPIPDYFSTNATDHETVERGRRYQESKGDYEDHDVDTRDSSYGEEEVRDEARDTMSGRSISALPRIDRHVRNLTRKYPKYTRNVKKLPTVEEHENWSGYNMEGGRKRRKRRRTKRLFHKRYVERGKR